MSVLCLQSTLIALIPCDPGVVGLPVLGWIREAVAWIRLSLAGGARALIAGAIVLALPARRTAPTTSSDAGELPGKARPAIAEVEMARGNGEYVFSD